MATAVVPKHLLDISHLKEVFKVLRKYHFTSARYYELGVLLGLSNDTLNVIVNDHRGDTVRCLLECLSAWLRKAENVESEGDPSWYTLIAALKSIGQHFVAEGIARDKNVTCMDAVDDREKHPACVIFARHQSQFLQALLPSLVILLHKEGITKEILPATGETGDLLTAVREAVCVNHKNLEKFAAILQLFPATVSVGNAILKDYTGKEFSDDSTDRSGTDRKGSIKIQIPQSFNIEIQSIRSKFAGTLLKVDEVLTDIPVDVLKKFYQLGYYYLQPQLATCQTKDDVLQVISKRCSLTNISLLEGAVDHFNIAEAKAAIQQYKESVKEFCQAVPLRLSLDEKLSPPSLLQCQTATFVVDRKVDDCTLSDIEDFINLAFEQLAPNVNVVIVRKGNSFTITCSFPLILSESLIETALHNLNVLVQNKGLLQLTIGYSTVYSSTTHAEVKMISDSKEMSSFESSKWVTAVYTSRGTLEQMIVSQTVQQYTETQIPESDLRAKLLAKIRAMKVEIGQLQSSLQLTKAGLEETLVESKGEIELLQEKISLLSVQLKKREEQNQRVLDSNESLQCQIVKLRAQLQTKKEKDKGKLSSMKEKVVKLFVPERHDDERIRTTKEVTERVYWYSDGVELVNPSVQKCRDVIADLKDNHQIIDLWYSSADSVLPLLPAVLQRGTIKELKIWNTSLTLQCIQSLSYSLICNKSLETLELNQSAITDELLDCLCLSLQHNDTLTTLELRWNNGMTSKNIYSLSDLLLTNSTLTTLNLADTSLSYDGVVVLLDSLTDNKTLERLRLDGKHETTCRQHPNYTLIEHRLDYC